MKIRNIGQNCLEVTLNMMPGTSDHYWRILYSYDTPVLASHPIITDNGSIERLYEITEKKFSKTTTKHINQYMANEVHLEHQKKYVPQEQIELIVSGTYGPDQALSQEFVFA